MQTPDVARCRVCGKEPKVEHWVDRIGSVEYVCEIQCQGHAREVGWSLDNAIEAQREAEAKWNRANLEGGK